MNSKKRLCVTTEHRTAFILLLDTSNSMGELVESGGVGVTKGELMADMVNDLLRELYLRAHHNGTLRNYFDVAILSYSGRGVESLLGEKWLYPIVDLVKDGNLIKLRTDTPFTSGGAASQGDVSTVVVEANGYTPMYEAYYKILEIAEAWCSDPRNRDSLAPFICNISDGQATDCDSDLIVEIADRIKALKTSVSDVSLYNIFLATDGCKVQPLLFPTDDEIESHPNSFFRAMARSSSYIPEDQEDIIAQHRELVRAQNIMLRDIHKSRYRAVGFNVSMMDLLSMISIGTLSVTYK